jgi:hypothetical protein
MESHHHKNSQTKIFLHFFLFILMGPTKDLDKRIHESTNLLQEVIMI